MSRYRDPLRPVVIAAVLAASALVPLSATEYVVDLIEPQFLIEITNQLAQGNQLVDVEMQPVNGATDVRYSGVFAPIGGSINYILRVDAATWDQWLADMGALDGRFLDFEVEVLNGEIVRSGLFWQSFAEDYDYAIDSNATESEFQTLLEDYQDQGRTLIDFESFKTPTGSTRYGGLWVDGSVMPRTNVLYGLTLEEVEDLLDPLYGRIVDIERYSDDQDRVRWGVVLAAYGEGDSLFEQGLDAVALSNADAARADQIVDIDTYESSPGILTYNASWGDTWKSLREVTPLVPSTALDRGQAIDDVISAFEANGAGEMGLFARHVRLEQSVEYKPDEPFYLASSAKVAIHARLWQLQQQGHLDVDVDTLRYSDSTDPTVVVPWFVDERPDCGTTPCGLSTGACDPASPDIGIDIPLRTLAAGMMRQSDNSATSMLVDDPTLGVAFDDVDLNEWVSSLPGVGRGFGILSSIQDLDRVIMWAGQFPNENDQPSYFGAPRAGMETVFRGGNLGYRECRNDNDLSWTGTPCGCSVGTPPTPRSGCPAGQTCTRRQDPWDDLITYLQSEDPNWPDDGSTFPWYDFNAGHARYYNSGLNWATPRAFGELQELFITGELHDAATLEDALGEMLTGGPLTAGRPSHIESYSKGGSKNGTSTPCSDTTMFRVGPDAVVVNVMTKNNQDPATPANRTCAQVRNFWSNPTDPMGAPLTPLGQAVLQRLLPDLTTAVPEVSAFSPATVRPGEPFEALVDITNVGQVETPTSFAVTFYAVVGNTVEEGTDDIGIGTVRVGPVAAGETVRVRLETEFPFITDGTYSFGWIIDPNSASNEFGEVGEFTEDQNVAFQSDNRGIRDGSVLTVLPVGPPCEDLDLDGYFACTPDCDARGLTCGDCNDDDAFVNPLGTEVCNQLDDDCDGVADPTATRPGVAQVVFDPDPGQGDEMGTSVARLGDLNGDGVDEFAVGQPKFDAPGAVGQGAVRVYDGATRALYCAVETVSVATAQFGSSIAGLGDVTGDGISDFVVGAPFYDGAFGDSGRAYVLDGATCGVHYTLVSPEEQSGELYGTGVGAPGDVDLDGIDDIAVGAPGRDRGASSLGAVDVFSGADGTLIRSLTDPNASNNDNLGKVMTSPGDLDGDLVPDLVVGVPDWVATGAVVVFSGRTGDVLATWERVGAEAGDKFGFSVASLGDVTGDGVPDVVVGAIDADTLAGDRTGDAQILSGADGTPVHTLSDLSGATLDDFGHAVSAAGDVDGDGLEDVAVGAPLHDTAAGEDAGHVVVFSSATGAVLYDLEDPNARPADLLGYSLARLDDLTGDGLAEFAAGAPEADGVETTATGHVLIWSMESDCDLDGFTPYVGDCDDQESDARPDAVEACDAIDNDCDMLIDEDDDGDSFAVCDDCDDADARIYPGAAERCNGLDDDCDTEIDEGVDADLDGYTDVCDCVDGNDAINPGAADTTCDRIDQDCNGVTDDGFDTPAGERLSTRNPGAANDQLGQSVAVIDDLNGDGLAEIVAGVPGDDTAVGGAGAVAVYDGATGALHCLMTDPDAEFPDGLGESVANAGDLDGDGVSDVVAGAPGDDDPTTNAGSLIVFSGADCSRIYKTFDPQGAANDDLGTTVAAVGDQNGDGFSEYAASAPDGDDFGLSNSGRVVVFDGATGSVLYRVNNLAPDANERFGTSIAGGHDLDADGIPDFVVGTEQDDTRAGNLSGSVLVVSGADGTPIRKLVDDGGAFADEMGWSVALIDDLDGDAVADILAGAPGSDTQGTRAGAVIVFSGADGSSIGRATFDQPGTQERLGWSVAAMPDIDGDDVPDIAASAPQDDDFAVDTGSIYLISGADLSLIQRFSRPEGQADAEVGHSIAVAPDLTGDGMPEIVAGAPAHDGDAGNNMGLVVVFALEADCDGDGVSPFGGDCDDGDGSAFGRPGDVEALVFDTKDTISWQPPAEPGGTVAGLDYDVLRSDQASDFTVGTSCEESGDTDTTATVPGVPVPGAAWFYVVRANNACDSGPAGFDSESVERPAQACP